MLVTNPSPFIPCILQRWVLNTIVNPRQVRDLAKATGRLAKTDIIDAQVMTLFAATVCPMSRPIPDEQTQEVRGILSRRRRVLMMLEHHTPRSYIAPEGLCH